MTKEELQTHKILVKESVKNMSTEHIQFLVDRHEYMDEVSGGRIMDNFLDIKASYEIYKKELIERILLTEGTNEEN